MQQKPQFTTDRDIIATLEKNYGLPVRELRFLPIGEDSWCYVAETSRQVLFIKLAKKRLDPASILISTMLHDRFGYQFVNPALRTKEGLLWTQLAEHELVVYPYVQGKTVMGSVLTPGQWQEIGHIIAILHQTKLDDTVKQALRVEDFAPPGAMGAKHVINYANTNNLIDVACTLAHFVRGRASEMMTIIARAEELGKELQVQRPELVLCHADPNQANILLTSDNRVMLVDWDGVLLAPRERDLTFFTGNELEMFLQGYDEHHRYKFDRTAVAYYKHEWVIQEFNDYGSRIFFKTLSDVEKQRALEEFARLFAPGDVVQDAYAADSHSQGR